MEEQWFRKHVKNITAKNITTCPKYAPKGGPPKVIFLCFLGSPSQDGLQGVPGQVPRPKSMLK
jgi:hypothetical protein